MTDLSPEQIRSYAQRIANITDEADRNAAIDEFAENHGTNIRRQVGEILQERVAESENGRTAQNNGTAYSQDNPYAPWAADDDEVRRNADDWEARKPLTETMLSEFNAKAERQGFATYIDSRHADGGVFQADKSVENGAYRIEIEGMFKNHGGQSVYEAARDFTVSFHENGEITDYLYTNDLDAALAQSNRWLQSHEMPPEKQSEPAPTAAEQAAVSVSGSPEPQAAAEQAADTQPESAAETAPDEENGIEFDGEAQDLEQEAPEAGPTFRQPETPAPERETITAEEVRQNLARARAAEALERQDGQKQLVLERQPETVPPQQEARPQGTPEADLGSLFDEAVPQSAREPAPSENPAVPQKSKPVLDLDYETASGLNQRYIRMEGKYLDLNNRTTVMFEDQGGKIKTAAADPQVIRDMLDTAQAKNWGSIKISGSREFKQAMWLEAELRGIPSTGYKPGREDLALRDQLLAERQRNGIEETQLQQAKQPENSPLPDQSAVVHSEAAQAAAKADTSKEKVLAAEIQHRAAQFANGQQRPTGQAAATPNHALESARALYQQQLGKSRKEVKATVQYLENIQRKMTETLEPALRDRQMQRFYESVTADMKSGNIPTPKRTAGQNQTHRNETRHPAHEQENEQEM